jgi:carboxylesterase type B
MYEQKWVARSNETNLRICIYLPENPQENVPGLLWIHGGGYAIGIPDQGDGFIKRL